MESGKEKKERQGEWVILSCIGVRARHRSHWRFSSVNRPFTTCTAQKPGIAVPSHLSTTHHGITISNLVHLDVLPVSASTNLPAYAWLTHDQNRTEPKQTSPPAKTRPPHLPARAPDSHVSTFVVTASV